MNHLLLNAFVIWTKCCKSIWKESKSKLPPGKVEVERYFESTDCLADNADPIEYWLNHQTTYPLLSLVAIDTLSISGSSAPVERVFSTAGDSTIRKRNRLSDHNLEQEVLLKKNKHFFVNTKHYNFRLPEKKE